MTREVMRGAYSFADVDIAKLYLAGVEITVTGAQLNAMVANIAAKYTKPGAGIPSTDLTAAVQASLGLADTSFQKTASFNFISGPLRVALNGVNPTKVLFGASVAATVLSDNAQTYNLTGVGDGGTIILNPDGAGADTATVNFAAGTHTGGSTASTDISTGVDNKFKIAVDANATSGTYSTVTLTLAGAIVELL